MYKTIRKIFGPRGMKGLGRGVTVLHNRELRILICRVCGLCAFGSQGLSV